MSYLYLNKTRLNFTSNFLDQNSLKSKYYCKNEFIYIRDFETVKKNSQSCSFRCISSRLRPNNTLLLVF